MSNYLEINLTLDGVDVEATVEYVITSYGSPAHMGSLTYPGDPGDPPECELRKITYTPGPENGEVEINYDSLSKKDQELIEQKIYEEIADAEPYDPY